MVEKYEPDNDIAEKLHCNCGEVSEKHVGAYFAVMMSGVCRVTRIVSRGEERCLFCT